ncbi:matrix metalloproteinase-2 [Musca domestica]|nr:matrix metalloproteinase-2 [Musca domestica]
MPNAGLVRMTLRKALNVWQNSSKLTFREVYDPQADIQVLFAKRDHGDGYKFDGPGYVLAHAFYPGVGRGGDAHFDDDENWAYDPEPGADNDSSGTDFLGVAVHEFGHSLGLGHSSDQNAIMFPWYQGYTADRELPADDRNAIQELYGAKVKSWGTYHAQPRPTRTTTTTTTTTPRPTRTYYTVRNYPNSNPYPYSPQRPNERHPYHNNNNNNNHHHNRNHHDPRYDHYTPRTYYPDYRTPPTTTTTTTTTTRRPYYMTTPSTTTTRPRPRHHPTHSYPPQRTPTKTHRPLKPRKPKPDSCATHYDAISIIRSELFIFRGQYLWRIGERGLYPGYPTETKRLWTALPSNFSKIDAVYENYQRHIVFFIGRKFYEFDSVTLIRENYLSALGLPATLPHIDAAFIWGYNNRTYLFSGTLYWSLDRETGRVELDYPRDMSIWSGIGYNIDAAFQYTNGKTYFFKGHSYWEFDDKLMRVAHPKPKSSARDWMKCPRNANEVDEEQRTAPLISEVENTGGNFAADQPRGSLYMLAMANIITLIWSAGLVRSWELW